MYMAIGEIMLRQIFSEEHMIASLLGSRKYFLHLPADTGGCEDIDHDDEVTLMHTSVTQLIQSISIPPRS